MNSYDDYIASLIDECKTVDIREQQEVLRFCINEGKSLLAPFKALSTELMELSVEGPRYFLDECENISRLNVVLEEWPIQLKKLEELRSLVIKLNGSKIARELEDSRRNSLHFVYQKMKWFDVDEALGGAIAICHSSSSNWMNDPPNESEQEGAAISQVEEQLEKEALAPTNSPDEALWAEAVRQNTVDSYQYYATKSLDGKHMNDAKAAVKRLIDAIDDIEWEKVRSTDTLSGYEVYRDTTKSGKHLAEAIEKIKSLTARPQQSTLFCTLCAGGPYPSHYPRCVRCGGSLVASSGSL